MAHNVFISWSKDRGRKLAEALAIFLPDVLQHATPWVSSMDIEKGRRWGAELATALDQIRVGIICVTPESLHSDWLLFEAGALAKSIPDSRTYVCPYLLGLKSSDIRPPLADFQVTLANEQDTFNLVSTLNAALGGTVDPNRLNRTFKAFWPALSATIEALEKAPPADAVPPPKRDAEDLFAEILNRLRDLQSPPPNVAMTERVLVSESDVPLSRAATAMRIRRTLEKFVEQGRIRVSSDQDIVKLTSMLLARLPKDLPITRGTVQDFVVRGLVGEGLWTQP